MSKMPFLSRMDAGDARRAKWPGLGLILLLVVALLLSRLLRPKAVEGQFAGSGAIEVTLTGKVVHPAVQRFGMNLGDQDFYDSGQMLRNLVFRNPGFEGAHERSILHCVRVTAAGCVDDNPDAAWKAGFWDGADVRALDGSATGRVATSRPPTKANPRVGLTLAFAAPMRLRAGAYIVLEKDFPGEAAAGWWTQTEGGAHLDAEFHDLSPESPGKQALRIDAQLPGQSATVSSYFDTTAGRSFLALRGHYRLSFRAKDLGRTSGGSAAALLAVSVGRANHVAYLRSAVRLTPRWENYRLDFDAHEEQAVGSSAALEFRLAGGRILLDDVSLEETADEAAGNPIAYRGAVVSALRELHPGVLRYMASHAGLGSTLENELRPPFARERTGYSAWSVQADDVPMGIGEFLALCERVRAEPWITLPAAVSDAEGAALMAYLAGPASSQYGRARALVHHPAPWLDSFARIHIEWGNEVWNQGFAGESIADPSAEAARATQFFHALRAAPGFARQKFDLVLGGQSDYPDRNRKLLAQASGFDTFATAPYLMHNLIDASTPEALFRPLLAQPEQMELAGGQVAEARDLARRLGVHLAAYETNLHTTAGSAPQAALDGFAPSLAAGIAVAEHLLRMQRDAGVQNALLFSLPQFEYRRDDGKHVRLWGSVIDMGATDRRRPQFLAARLVNEAIGDGTTEEVEAQIANGGPALAIYSANDAMAISAAHLLDAFAFTSSGHHSLVLLNLDLHSSRQVALRGAGAPPAGALLHVRVLTTDSPAATNEDEERVTIRELPPISSGLPITLSPLSISVVTW